MAGRRNVGTTTKIGYFSQHRAMTLNENNSVLGEVIEAGGGMRENEARAILGSFLFKKDDVSKRVKILSGDANWPKSSPNINSCSIKISHRETSL